MKNRVRKFIDEAGVNDFICTYHGFCVKVLREAIHKIAYPSSFIIMDEEDQKSVLREIYEELKLKQTDLTFKKVKEYITTTKYYPSDNIIKTYIKNHIDISSTVTDTEIDENENIMRTCFIRYLQKQRKGFMLDFDVNNATAYQLSSSESNKNKFYNVLSTFADKGWCYTRDGDGECLYKCYYIDGSLDMYRELNEGRTLWNPTDMTKKITHSYFIEDGSFLRCQDLTVGYTLPGNLTSKWGISKARFYVSASNLFIITGYSGYDPEVDIQTGLTCGMDYNRYPRSRSFVLGTNITF